MYTLSQTSSVESMIFPKNGLTAALETKMSMPPHFSTVLTRETQHLASYCIAVIKVCCKGCLFQILPCVLMPV